MIKLARCFVLLALLTAGVTGALGKNLVAPRVYMFGFAASFNDTIVHYTEVQQVDSAWMNVKTKFLAGREYYSYQLRDYLANQLHMPNRTCIVMYDFDRAKLEKKFLKLKRQYENSKRNSFDIRPIALSDFVFKPVNMSDFSEESDDTPKKAAKEKVKKKAKEKRPGKPGKRPAAPPQENPEA